MDFTVWVCWCWSRWASWWTKQNYFSQLTTFTGDFTISRTVVPDKEFQADNDKFRIQMESSKNYLKLWKQHRLKESFCVCPDKTKIIMLQYFTLWCWIKTDELVSMKGQNEMHEQKCIHSLSFMPLIVASLVNDERARYKKENSKMNVTRNHMRINTGG